MKNEQCRIYKMQYIMTSVSFLEISCETGITQPHVAWSWVSVTRWALADEPLGSMFGVQSCATPAVPCYSSLSWRLRRNAGIPDTSSSLSKTKQGWLVLIVLQESVYPVVSTYWILSAYQLRTQECLKIFWLALVSSSCTVAALKDHWVNSSSTQRKGLLGWFEE